MSDPGPPRVNVSDRLAAAAAARPGEIAVAAADGRGGFRTITFGELNADADVIARGLLAMGIGPGKRIALLVRPGIDFVTLVFAMLRTGATMVLVDAGLGRQNIVRCLESTEPDGFVAIPLGHALRVLKRSRFPQAKLNVTVGRRWFWGGETLASLRKLGGNAAPPTGVGGSPSPDSAIRNPQSAFPATAATDAAAIVFTSGSTGPPKGVLYTHQTFETQCSMIQAEYAIRPGDVDLACFPLFGLFNVACGVTTVLPEMDFSRPASCDPQKILAAANQWRVTQAFASPAVWDRVSRHCESTGESIPTLRKLLSCGAPVPAKVIRRTLACVHPEAQMHTPYGATEALPIATIEAREILNETTAKTDEGAGVCVGRNFGAKAERGRRKADNGEPSTPVVGVTHQPTFDWRIIRITDDPIATIVDTEELPDGEIGELIVRGPQVSTHYLTGEPSTPVVGGNDHNAKAKIADGDTVWHRMGDVGYFDDEGRFWYCGRKSQRVVTSEGTLFTECVEQVCNAAEHVEKAALVSVPAISSAKAVLVVDGVVNDWEEQCDEEMDELLSTHPKIQAVTNWIMYCGPLPTDIRHNSKIRREELAVWAEKQLRKREA